MPETTHRTLQHESLLKQHTGAISESESEDEVVTDGDSENENGEDFHGVEGVFTVEEHKALLLSETVSELRRR